ncbi:Protein YobA (fragment) [Candidatus Nitrosocosmicus franklandus]|uniref:Protein YobA n=1 Tax=Candidatus Nitrosocosmicus franklandianus TaxID=1798806 RepID=A0A484I7X2_9ARCH
MDARKSLSISLDKSRILPGIYTTDWFVLSKKDDHITRGSYVFLVEENNV